MTSEPITELGTSRSYSPWQRASTRITASSMSAMETGSFSHARSMPWRIRSRSKRTRSPFFLMTRSGLSSMRS